MVVTAGATVKWGMAGMLGVAGARRRAVPRPKPHPSNGSTLPLAFVIWSILGFELCAGAGGGAGRRSGSASPPPSRRSP